MSDIGAMATYLLARVAAVRAGATPSQVEIPLQEIAKEDLPHVMLFDPVQSVELDVENFRQQIETTQFTMIYTEEFQADASPGPQASLLATYEAIRAEVYGANVIDVDTAGFFAHVSSMFLAKAADQAERMHLVCEILIETIDVADSNFALVE